MVAIEAFVESSRSNNDLADLKRTFLRAMADEGYENVVFARAKNGRLDSVPWSEFPPGYLDTYRSRQWDRIDPVVHYVNSARGPFRWSDSVRNVTKSAEQARFFAECRELGVHSGITIPIRGPAYGVDLISVSLRDRRTVDQTRMPHLHMIATQYWLRYCEIFDREEDSKAPLTGKETECLCWCKEGKTNWEIGEILSISEKTVEFHLGNAMRKLGAGNRITAVMIGIKRGLIAL